MDRFVLWRRWLVAAGGLLAAFGVAMALTSGTQLFEPLNRLIDPAFWSDGPTDQAAIEFRAWIYGTWGATIAGWGVTVVFVAWYPFGRRERWAWWAIASGTSLWFALDTALSIAHGVLPNVLVNLAVAALVAPPLVATRRLVR